MKKYPIVILPGWLLGPSRFEALKSEFTKKGYSVSVVSFPGFEEGPSLTKPWNLVDYVGFVESYLREKKLKDIILICHSFGGRVGLKMLAQNPTLAKKLVLTGTPGYRGDNTKKLYLISKLAKTGKKSIEFFHLGLLEDLIRKIFYKLIGTRDIKQLKGYLKQTFINVVEEDLEEYMRKLEVPTLLLWGDDDSFVSPVIAQKMNRTIGNSTLKVIKNAKHNVVYKKPKIFAQNVLEYVYR